MEFVGVCCLGCKHRNKDSFRNFGKCNRNYLGFHKTYPRTIIPNHLYVVTWCHFKEKKGQLV